jgi:exosortase/archaeosortase family protein
VFLAAYLWLFRERLRFPNALLLIPLATLAMFAANSLRLAMLIGIGHAISPEVAVGGFHANSGSLLLCLVALGIAWGAPHSAAFGRETVRAATAEHNPSAAYLAPLVALFAAAMITGALTKQSQAGFDVLYGARVLVSGAVLWAYRRD